MAIFPRGNAVSTEKNMKIKYLISALAVAMLSFTSAARQPADEAHMNAHKNRHIARNVTPMIPKEQIPGLETQIPQQVQEEASKIDRIIDDLLTEANKHIGKPYVHGAKGPRAFDCSGFSSYVYRQFGYTLSPASRMQAKEGVAVEKGDLRKGDLVFFTSRRSGGGVGHVGIVVSADNATGKFSFIHASLKGVKISQNEGYYAGRYLFARRVITE